MEAQLTDTHIGAIRSFLDTVESIDKGGALLDNMLQDALFHQQEQGGEACGCYYLYVRNLKEFLTELKSFNNNTNNNENN